MAKIYGHKWTSSFGEADDGTWLQGLQGLHPPQLAVGLRRCLDREDPWPPNLPEFRRLCLPTIDDLKFPTVEEAFKMASLQVPGQMQQYVQAARDIVGPWDLRTKPTDKTFPKFAKAYGSIIKAALHNAAHEESLYYLTNGDRGRLYITQQ